MLELEQVLTQVKEWCKEVGMIQLEKLNSKLEIQRKSDEIDLVTEVDRLSEGLLIDRIKKNYSEHSILSEESGKKDKNSEYLWIIDPIDGTTNYANGFFIFSISIALQYQGKTVLGVVYAPKLDYLYSAIKGEGAYLNGERIKVSSAQNLKESILATGFPYDRASDPNNNIDNFSRLIIQVRGIRRTGSAALDLCNVAQGAFNGYWELKLKLWDIAAGLLIVEEAGGKAITSYEGNGINVIAGNKKIVELLAEQLIVKWTFSE